MACYCRTTSASTAPCTSRRMRCPAHCASQCAPCQPLLRAFFSDGFDIRLLHHGLQPRPTQDARRMAERSGHPRPATPTPAALQTPKVYKSQQFTRVKKRPQLSGREERPAKACEPHTSRLTKQQPLYKTAAALQCSSRFARQQPLYKRLVGVDERRSQPRTGTNKAVMTPTAAALQESFPRVLGKRCLL